MYRYKKIKLKDGSTIDEHRLIMQEYLGRDLDSCEVVHHCNEDPMRNEIENLELMLDTEHKRLHQTGRDQSDRYVHGQGRYAAGCRCEACRAGHALNNRKWRANRG